MSNDLIKLAYELNKDIKHGDEWLTVHCKRLAEKAIELKFDETIVYACYLHESLLHHYDDYYNTFKKIERLDKRVADLVDKCTWKKSETQKEFYRRILYTKDSTILVGLDMLDEVLLLKDKTLIEYLPKFLNRIIG